MAYKEENQYEVIAQKVQQKMHPKTVLCIGNELEGWVPAFWEKDVQVYGLTLSFSVYVNLPSHLQLVCSMSHSLEEWPQELPKHFDLIILSDVLEELSEESLYKVIHRLSQSGDRVLLYFPNRLHLEERQKIHMWVQNFAQESLFRDFQLETEAPDNRMVLLSHQENFLQVIAEYETHLNQTAKTIEDLLAQGHRYQEEQSKDVEPKDRTLQGEYEDLVQKYREAQETIERLHGAEEQYQHMLHSFSWKITKPLRALHRFFKNLFYARSKHPKSSGGIITKGVNYWKKYGFKMLLKKLKGHNHHSKAAKTYILRHLPSKLELAGERETIFRRPVWFSIVVPLYNTPEKFLREMIESVQKQTYQNWQLCLADGSDQQHESVRQICLRYAKSDQRIDYKKLDKNLGIAENTNACIEMATGEYIGLLDHDDILHPSALFEVMTVIEEKQADFIYTDEATFKGSILNPITVHLKSDFAIDLLRANNYICHFSCFSRKLLNQAGWFRDKYNGSQDYDMILRLTEQAQTIFHIRKVLYFWRSHPGSVAQELANKPYCVEAAKKALKAHLDRCKIEGAKVTLAPHLDNLYRIIYPIIGEPMISIIIPNHNHFEDLYRCVHSILNQSTYIHYEILIIENGNSDEDTLSMYGTLKEDPRVRVLYYEGDFNYSKINNYGAAHANGEYLLLLNNDTEVISPDWMEQLLMFAQRSDVGAVGAKLYFGNHALQHCGIAIDIGSAHTAGYLCYELQSAREEVGYMGRLMVHQNVSAVTGACLMVSKEKYQEVGGLDEEFKVAYHDVDFCLKLRDRGYVNVFTPMAELYHYSSKDRGVGQHPKNQERLKQEETFFKERWKKTLEKGDPYYPQGMDRNGWFGLDV